MNKAKSTDESIQTIEYARRAREMARVGEYLSGSLEQYRLQRRTHRAKNLQRHSGTEVVVGSPETAV